MGPDSCWPTRTGSAVIMSATLRATTTDPSRKSNAGCRSAIRWRSTLHGSRQKGWRIRRRSSASRAKWLPASTPPPSSHKTRRFPIREGSTRIFMPETVATVQRPQTTGSGVRELTFAEAIREALAEEMRRDPTVFVIGEDVAEAGTPFKVVKGLVDEFGKARVVDTPISEAGFTGLAVGAAMAGMRPVVDIMFGDFMTLIMDQVVNQAAKIHYMSGGKWKVPMVIRATMGATRRSAAQHSQSLHAWPSHIPGLKVAIPSTPYDAKGLLKAAIRDDNPVVIFEDKISYAKVKGPVPDEEYVIPLGVADIKREGSDISIIATSSMVQVALGAAAMLEEVGVDAEVVDPRTTWPLDERTLIDSVRKTSRCIVIDEGYFRYGITGEIASVVAENAFYDLDGPVRRLGARHVPIPFAPPLEDVTVPNERDVVALARQMCNK